MLKEFREFAMRGNMVDMAVGIIIGTAFGGIIKSLVSDVIMPPIGLLLGKVDFSNLFAVLRFGNSPAPYPSLDAARTAGAVTLNYGLFVNTLINFLIVAFAIFIVVKAMNATKRKQPAPAPATKDCPFCFTAVPVRAVRCPHCTSDLKD